MIIAKMLLQNKAKTWRSRFLDPHAKNIPHAIHLYADGNIHRLLHNLALC